MVADSGVTTQIEQAKSESVLGPDWIRLGVLFAAAMVVQVLAVKLLSMAFGKHDDNSISLHLGVAFGLCFMGSLWMVLGRGTISLRIALAVVTALLSYIFMRSSISGDERELSISMFIGTILVFFVFPLPFLLFRITGGLRLKHRSETEHPGQKTSQFQIRDLLLFTAVTALMSVTLPKLLKISGLSTPQFISYGTMMMVVVGSLMLIAWPLTIVMCSQRLRWYRILAVLGWALVVMIAEPSLVIWVLSYRSGLTDFLFLYSLNIPFVISLIVGTLLIRFEGFSLVKERKTNKE
jgi:hypothetical protein